MTNDLIIKAWAPYALNGDPRAHEYTPRSFIWTKIKQSKTTRAVCDEIIFNESAMDEIKKTRLFKAHVLSTRHEIRYMQALSSTNGVPTRSRTKTVRAGQTTQEPWRQLGTLQWLRHFSHLVFHYFDAPLPMKVSNHQKCRYA
jgi:hypothetical protein